MVIEKFKIKEKIEVNTPKQLKEILKYCNPLMMNFYKSQLPSLSIKGFGQDITIKKVGITNEA
ncbi:hypothetical protein AFAEC_0576 [Aliarcobacter faecis]|nr:hypothetical protein AFAEC_0576 [Aliarcobacter faecis]